MIQPAVALNTHLTLLRKRENMFLSRFYHGVADNYRSAIDTFLKYFFILLEKSSLPMIPFTFPITFVRAFLFLLTFAPITKL